MKSVVFDLKHAKGLGGFRDLVFLRGFKGPRLLLEPEVRRCVYWAVKVPIMRELWRQ